nr:hypothetical protein [Tanacetum cinerariifolium]
MANVTFVDSHNMVAYLEKSAENVDFAEIVDFLNANSIKYALTVSPTIYVSYIEQFWSTAKTKTINNETQICAKVNANETVHEERGDRVERAATTAAGLDAKQDSENNKTAQDLEITHLNKRVKRMEKKRKSRTPQLKRSINITTAEPVTTVSASITTAGVSVSAVELSTPPTTTPTVIEDEDLIIAQTLMKMKSEKSKEKAKERGSKEKSSETATRPTRRVIMREASETTTRPTVPPQKKLDPKDKDADHELAKRLQVEEQRELTIEERLKLFVELINERKKHFARLRVEEKRRKPPTKAQKWNQMLKDSAEGSETRAKGSSKRVGEELESDKSKKQKLDEKVEAEEDNDQEEAEMKMYIKIVSGDEVAIDAIPLATKPPIIIDWKIIK